MRQGIRRATPRRGEAVARGRGTRPGIRRAPGDATRQGGKGNDILEASQGDTRWVRGQGDDTLESGWGADPFVFREGDGHDTIDGFGSGHLEFHLNLPATTPEAVAFAGLQIKAQGHDTVIRYGAGDDTSTLEDMRARSLTLDNFDFVFVG